MTLAMWNPAKGPVRKPSEKTLRSFRNPIQGGWSWALRERWEIQYQRSPERLRIFVASMDSVLTNSPENSSTLVSYVNATCYSMT